MFVGTLVVYEFGFLDGVATFYLILASFALCAKNALRWYQGWEYLRKVFNNQNRSKILSEILTGKSKTQTVGGFVLAGLPTNTPAQVRVEVARSMAGLTPELDHLVTPVGKA